MNGYAVALFAATLAVVLVYIPFRFVYLERVRRVNQKYPLFAVRDELVHLRINGDFDGDLELYDFYCDACNAFIVHTRELNLSNFLSALQDITPENQKEAEERCKRIERSSRAAIAAVCQFYETVENVLMQNSTLLRVLLKLRLSDQTLKRAGDASDPLGSDKLLALKEYQAIKQMRRTLTLQYC